MNLEETRYRLKIANKWSEIIKTNYTNSDNLIESQTEYFLIVCRSIRDYILFDCLSLIDPKMKKILKADIVELKSDYTSRNPKHKDHVKIIEFLDEYKTKVKGFENDLLVKYFIALRNWTVHSIFPNIYENQYGENDTVISRRFQRDFIEYLELEQGGHLLLNTGEPLELEKSGKESIFEKYPLNNLDSEEKSALRKRLENEDPFDLMNEYLSKIVELIEYFEKNY